MPTIRIEMFTGRTPQQKRDLARALTEAATSVLGVDPMKVKVRIDEVERYHQAIGGELQGDPPEA